MSSDRRYPWETQGGTYNGLLLGVGSPSRPVPNSTSATHPIRVDWIEIGTTGTAGALGMTICPGRVGGGRTANYSRDLASDMKVLRKEHKVDVLVNLIEDHEFKSLKVQKYFDHADENDIHTLWFSIPDGGIPSNMRKARALVDEIVGLLRYGFNVVIHCKAGLGRTGLLVACVLVRLGYKVDNAVSVVRDSRKGTIENSTQMKFVTKFRGRRFCSNNLY
jgi:protein-tyrosine phosphatase